MHQHATLWPGCTCPQKQHAEAPDTTTCALLGLADQELRLGNCSIGGSVQSCPCAALPWPRRTYCARRLPQALAAATKPRLLHFHRHRKMPWDVPVPEAARSPATALSRRQKVYLQRKRGNEATSCAGSWRQILARMRKHYWTRTRAQGQWRDSTQRPGHRPYHDACRTLAGGHAPPHRRHVHCPAEDRPPGGTAWKHAGSRQQGFEC